MFDWFLAGNSKSSSETVSGTVLRKCNRRLSGTRVK